MFEAYPVTRRRCTAASQLNIYQRIVYTYHTLNQVSMPPLAPLVLPFAAIYTLHRPSKVPCLKGHISIRVGIMRALTSSMQHLC